MTVRQYYSRFRSLYGSATTAIGSLPLVSQLLPEKWGLYIFPPLSTSYRMVALILAGLSTVLVFFCQYADFVNSKKSRLRALVVCMFLTVLGALSYIAATQRFVRQIDITSEKKTVTVTVGYERTPFAKATFPNATDWEMLDSRGPSEEEVWKLWTTPSVIIARVLVFACYLFFLLTAVVTGGLGVLYEAIGTPTQ